MDLLPIFYDLDEFCRQEEAWRQQHWLDTPQRQCQRDANLCLSEVRTLVIAFHRSGYRTFKHFYLVYAQRHLRRDFPGLVSYSRFVETEAGGPGASVRLPATPERLLQREWLSRLHPQRGLPPQTRPLP